MITTQQLATELKIGQRSIQHRIYRLGLKVQRAGNTYILTREQAQRVRDFNMIFPRKKSASAPN
mgnify:CR=1 FL=1